jgi:hypothetical protein
MSRSLSVVLALAISAAACGGEKSGSPGADTAAPPAPASSPAPAPTAPAIDNAPAATITQSAVFQGYDASGLLQAAQPGWHALGTGPHWIELTFEQPQTIRQLSLLPQDGAPARAPKEITVEISKDGKSWSRAARIADACVGGESAWRTFPLERPIETTRMKLTITSNCGDPSLLTFRGLKFE